MGSRSFTLVGHEFFQGRVIFKGFISEVEEKKQHFTWLRLNESKPDMN